MLENSRVKVKLIQTEGQAALVEYQKNGQVKRAIVPHQDVRGGRITQEVLDKSIEYSGVELSDYLPERLVINLSELQTLLRQRGIWTAQEYLENPSVVMGCLQKLYGVDTTRILNAIEAGEDYDNDL